MSTTPTPSQLDNAYRLADGLEKVAQEWPERFDMVSWLRSDGRFDPSYEAHLVGEHPQDCGTVACALGWAPYLLGEPVREDERSSYDAFGIDGQSIYYPVSWRDYARRVLGISGEWEEFTAIFGSDRTIRGRGDEDPDHGAEGALAAARRLRAWADAQVAS